MGASVYAFGGGKGGVGKTTVTANVAVALTEKGYDVCAVDADVGMTNLGELLGVETSVGIHEILAETADLEEAVVEGPAGVGVVPGSDQPGAMADADPANLRAAIDPLRERADVVLLDTGAGLSHQNLVAYGLADALTLVATPDRLAVGDAGKASELAGRVDCPILGTVLTRVRAEADAESIAARLGSDVVAAVPEYEDATKPEPRVQTAPDSPAAAEYRGLATMLAVCHQTGDMADAASAASQTVELPAGSAADEAQSDSPGVVDRLLARLR